MAEGRHQPIGAGRRLRRFVLIVIWAVPLTYFSAFMNVVTGATAQGMNETKSGDAVVHRCYPDGPLGLHLWHSCDVSVRWDGGGQGQRVVQPPDLGPEDVGKQVNVVYLDGKGTFQVRVDEDRPWWWVWWLTGAPALALALLLVIIAVFTVVRGSAPDPTRTKPQRPRRLQS